MMTMTMAHSDARPPDDDNPGNDNDHDDNEVGEGNQVRRSSRDRTPTTMMNIKSTSGQSH